MLGAFAHFGEGSQRAFLSLDIWCFSGGIYGNSRYGKVLLSELSVASVHTQNLWAIKCKYTAGIFL